MTPILLIITILSIAFLLYLLYLFWYVSGAKFAHLIGLYTFIIPISFVRIPLGGSVSLRVEELLLGASVFLVILHRKEKFAISPRGRWGIFFFAVFVFTAILSQFFFKEYYVPASYYNLTKIFGAAAFFFIGVFACRSKEDLRIIGVWASFSIMVMFVVLVYYSGVSLLSYESYHAFKTTLSKSVYINPEWGANAIGEYGAFLAMLSAIGFISTDDRKSRTIQLIGIIIGTLLPMLVLSRGAIGGIIVFYAIWIWHYKKELRRVAIPLFVALIVIIIFLTAGLEERKDVMELDIKTGKGFSGRYEVWEASLMAFEEKPLLGWGMGTERWILLHFGSKTHSGHNTFIIILIQLGIVGTLIFSGFLIALGLPYQDDIRKSVNAMFLAMLMTSMFSGSMFFAKIALPGMCVAFAVATWPRIIGRQTSTPIWAPLRGLDNK